MRALAGAAVAAMMTAVPAQAADTYSVELNGFQRDGEDYSGSKFVSTDQKDTPLALSFSGKTSATMTGRVGQDSIKLYSQSIGGAGALAAPAGISATASGGWRHDLTPNGSGLMTMNGYAAFKFALTDPMDLAARAAAIDLKDPSVTGLPEGSAVAFEVGTTAIVQLSLENLTVGGFDSLYARYDLSRTIRLRRDFANGGAWMVEPGSGTTDGFFFQQTFDANGFSSIDQAFGGNQLDVARNFKFMSNINAAHSYALSMKFDCWSVVRSLQGDLAGTSATCDGANSAYWNGVTGAPSGFSFTDSSGQNFLFSSPLSPAPLVTPNAIPEPATWAMLVGGFALAGAAARRRSRIFVAA